MQPFRAIAEGDRSRLLEWMSRDPDHKGLSPDVWYEPGTETMVFEDEQGPVLFVRLSRMLRVDIQFDNDQPERNREMMIKHFPWVRQAAKDAGFRQMIFDSVSKRLIRFCCKRLGFKPSPNEFIAYL